MADHLKKICPKPNVVVWSVYPYLGLNNIPICTVNDDDNSLGALWGVGQFDHLEKDEITFAKSGYAPSAVAPESPVRGVSPAPNNVKVPPRPHSGESLATHEIFPEASCKLSGAGGGEGREDSLYDC